MNLHPVLLAVIVVDVLGAGALVLAAPTFVRVLLAWREGDPSEVQLALERKAELASAASRFGALLHAAGFALTLLAVNHALPAIVPGAMCGFGAVQALPGGRVMLLVRVLSLLALAAWWEVDRADRATPLGALTVSSARAMLAAFPIAMVSVWQTIDALLHVDVHAPVSCCAAVFDLAGAAARGAALPPAGTGAVALTVLGGLALAGAAVGIGKRPDWSLKRPGLSSLIALLTAGWTAVAVWTLVDVGAPYVYGVVGHRCPFCLMLPTHGAAGYLAYGAIALVLVESVRAATAARVGAAPGADGAFARRSLRARLGRVAIGIALFLAAGFGPALLWRIREGVWIAGG